MKTFHELFKTILTADKDKSRKTAREVRKFLYSSSGERSKYKHISAIVDHAPSEYEKIKEMWRQENFVVAVSVIYFLHDKERQPDFLFPWLFKLIQHENGYIRYSAIRMFEIELGPLSYHIRFPGEKSILGLSPKLAGLILFEMYINLNNLMAAYWKKEYKQYKYISSIPVGVYKSIQLLLARLEDICGKEYINHLTTQIHITKYQKSLRA